MLHLDYISCFLTILSTVLIGKRLWYGWIIAGINSLVVCVIGVQTAQYGFLPGNLFCIVLYPPRLRVILPELFLGQLYDLACVVEEDCP